MAVATISITARTHSRQRPAPRPFPFAKPSLSVVIVNYCQWRNTALLTQQLRQSHVMRSGEAEIVIVDNHSPKHRLLSKLRRVSGVSLRRFGRNRGFARAVNEGCRLSEGSWILLLNPDVSVSRDFLDRVEIAADRMSRDHPRVGIIGLGVLNADGSPQASCGRLPTLWRTLAGLFLPRARRKCHKFTGQARETVDWNTGCAVLIRRDCLDEIGGLDEDFFLYYEDVDLCRRAAESGWQVCHEPSLQVTHHTPLHSRSVPAPLRLMTRHALLTYGIKHWPRWQTRVLGTIVRLESLARQAWAELRGRSSEAHFHRETRSLAGDLLARRHPQARARIRAAAGQLEQVSAAQDGRTC